jgi:hypothetical protein
MSDLLLLHVLSRASSVKNLDDYDVIGAEGDVIGCIVKTETPADGGQWIWTLAYGQYEDRTPTRGFEPTRKDAMKAFARSWHRE